MLLTDATPSIFEAAATEVFAVRLPTLSHWETPRALLGKDGLKSRTLTISIPVEETLGGSMTPTQETACLPTSCSVIGIQSMMRAETISASFEEETLSPFPVLDFLYFIRAFPSNVERFLLSRYLFLGAFLSFVAMLHRHVDNCTPPQCRPVFSLRLC